MGQLATASGTAKSISVISSKSRIQNSYGGLIIFIPPLPQLLLKSALSYFFSLAFCCALTIQSAEASDGQFAKVSPPS